MKTTVLVWVALASVLMGWAGEFDARESWWYQKALVDDAMLGRLHLTAQQKARFDVLSKEFGEKREQWLNANRERLRALEQTRDAAKSAGDAGKADVVQTEYLGKLNELVAIRQDLIQTFRAELTPGQRKEFDDGLATQRKGHGDTENANKPY